MRIVGCKKKLQRLLRCSFYNKKKWNTILPHIKFSQKNKSFSGSPKRASSVGEGRGGGSVKGGGWDFYPNSQRWLAENLSSPSNSTSRYIQTKLNPGLAVPEKKKERKRGTELNGWRTQSRTVYTKKRRTKKRYRTERLKNLIQNWLCQRRNQKKTKMRYRTGRLKNLFFYLRGNRISLVAHLFYVSCREPQLAPRCSGGEVDAEQVGSGGCRESRVFVHKALEHLCIKL